MIYIRWFLFLLFWTVVAGFLHYTLPQRDIVLISETEVRRTDVSEFPLFWASGDAAGGGGPNRDVYLVQTVRPNGNPMVYRNEDTGWGWPPYFKFDTADLQAKFSTLRSTQAQPRWVAVRHYGWRSDLLSIYPNALSVKEVDGPDVFLFPWLNVAILVSFFAVFWALRVRWMRFRENRLDPVFDAIGEWFENTWRAISRGFGRGGDS